jgi:Gamma interferon inducible lysosomal thiol reductase (GILT)
MLHRANEGDDGVECMHGPTECLGNMIELCASNLYPDPKLYLGFTMCLSQNYERIAQQDFMEQCALEHGLDFGKLNHCLSRDDGGYALGLLRTSFEHSKEVGVQKSCTVRLDNKVRCVMDGGEWSDCEGGHEVNDLIIDIKKLSGR